MKSVRFFFFLGGGEGVSTVFAKQASKKKIELHVDYVRSAPLGPAANRLEVDRAVHGLRCERVRRTSPSNAYKEKQVVEEFSGEWMILVTVRDRRRIENLLSMSCAPAVPRPRNSRTSRAEAPLLRSFFPTRRRQACCSASPLLPAVQSGRRHCEIRSVRQQFIPPRRTWVLTRSECSPTTWASLAVHDSTGTNFNFALGRETYPRAV